MSGTMLADTPAPPYYAVIFASVRTDGDDEHYGLAAQHMVDLARRQPGYLGHDSARADAGITVSYWTDLEAITAWKRQLQHAEAQGRGRREWYRRYTVRIARVERAYSFDAG